MKKMINIIIPFVLLGCTYNIQKTFFNNWKKDERGCNLFRHKQHHKIMQNKKYFIGLSEKEIIDKLGLPDQIANNNDLIYFVEPGIQCLIDSTITDAKSLNVRLNNDKVIDVYFMVP